MPSPVQDFGNSKLQRNYLRWYRLPHYRRLEGFFIAMSVDHFNMLIVANTKYRPCCLEIPCPDRQVFFSTLLTNTNLCTHRSIAFDRQKNRAVRQNGIFS